MIRETSTEAYHKIKEDGLLSKRRFEVYDYVFNNGPCTSKKAYKNLCAYKITNPSSYIGRFTELRNSGGLKEVGHEIDADSGMRCILWDVTKNIPVKADKKLETKCPHCNGKGKISTQQTRMF